MKCLTCEKISWPLCASKLLNSSLCVLLQKCHSTISNQPFYFFHPCPSDCPPLYWGACSAVQQVLQTKQQNRSFAGMEGVLDSVLK